MKIGCKMTLKAITFVMLFAVLSSARANPDGAAIAAGQATITSPNAHTVHINQTTNKAIINWQSFNIQHNETTRFKQPSAKSIILNRINPANGISKIYGKLLSNGNVWLLNPAGIYFGPSAYVNVAGLLATTADINDADFMNGNYHFKQSPYWNGSIINDGKIIAHKGAVALFAPGVENNNLVMAYVGDVVLGAANEFTLDFYGDGMVQYDISEGVAKKGVDSNNKELQYILNNKGKLISNGGRVIMSVKTARNIIDNVVNTDGLIRANSARLQKNGEIILSANGGSVNVKGKIQATGKRKGETGGVIQILGDNITINNADIDASGNAGGGTILIGGDYKGQNTKILNATNTSVGSDVLIKANAAETGNGGKVIIWSDNNTNFHGSISAQGGADGGNGGFIETSGKNYLNVSGARVNASAANGNAGMWLLDPRNVVISSSSTTCSSPPCFSAGDPTVYTPDTNSSQVDVADILAALEAGTSVTITTGNTGTQAGTIAVNTAITKTNGSTPVTLTLDSSDGGGTITVSNPISSTSGMLGLTLNSGNAITINGDITTNGGAFNSTSENNTNISASRTITTDSGDVNIFANADGAGGQDFVMNASSTINSGGGAVNINVNSALGGTGQATLANIDAGGGTLTVATDYGSNTTGTVIVQAGTSTVTAGDGIFSTGNGNITLDNANDFTSTLSITTNTTGRTIILNDINSLELGNITMVNGTGTLTITSNGAITQAASTAINSGTSLSSFDSGATGAAITLTNANLFRGPVGLTTIGANNASLTNTSDLSLDNINVGGDLNISVSNGSMSQATAARTIVVAGNSTFTGTGTGDSITVANANNQFTGTVNISNEGSNDININNSKALVLGTINAGNNFTATTTGIGSSITQNGILTISGTSSFDAAANAITLTNTANSLTGAVSLTNSGANDVSLVNNDALILGTSSIGQNLNLTANGSISQTGAVTASSGTTTLTLTAANSDILLDTLANNFGSSAIIFGGVVDNIRDIGIQNSNAAASVSDFSSMNNLRNLTLNYSGTNVILPALTLHSGGNLNITARGAGVGAVTQSGALIVPGTATFTSTTGTSSLRSVVLTNNSNQFSGAVSVSNSGASTVNIKNSTALILGDFTLGSGLVTLDGDGISQSSGALFTASGDMNLAGNAGAINFTSTGNNFSGDVYATNTAVNSVNISNTSTLRLADITLTGNSNLTATGVNLAVIANHTISTSGDITLNSGTGTLSTNNNTLLFTSGAINFIGDSMTLNTAGGSQIGGTSLGSGTSSYTTLTAATAGTTIGIAGGTGGLNLSQNELNKIYATNVRIGDSTAGAIDINPWSPAANFASNGVLTLASASAITQGGGSGIDLSANGASLALRSATSVALANTNNIFSNIAANITGGLTLANSANTIVTALTDDLGAISGITANGAVTVTASGTLAVNNDITSTNNAIALTGIGFTQAASTMIDSGSDVIAIDGGGSSINFNNGTLKTTNSGASAVIIHNASTIALGNIDAALGTVTIGSGDVTDTVTQNASTNISANALQVTTSGSITLDRTNNVIASLLGVTRGGTFYLANTGALAITGSIAAGTITNPVTILTTGGMTLSPGVVIAADTSGDAIVLSGATFTNNSGASALDPGSGRFLIWSTNPNLDNRGGLPFDFKQYNATYGVTTVLGSGNGFLYTIAPTVTISLTGTTSKVYDADTTASLTAANYTVSSGIDGDTVSTTSTPTSGNYTSENVGTALQVSVTGLTSANITATDGSATVYGYQLSSSSAVGNIGEITARPISLSPDEVLSREFGAPNPTTTTTFTVGGLGLAGTDSISTLGVTSNATVSSTPGSYDLSGSASGTVFSSGIAGNYNISYDTLTDGLLVTASKPQPEPTPNNPSISLEPQIIMPYTQTSNPALQSIASDSPAFTTLFEYVQSSEAATRCKVYNPFVKVCDVGSRNLLNAVNVAAEKSDDQTLDSEKVSR